MKRLLYIAVLIGLGGIMIIFILRSRYTKIAIPRQIPDTKKSFSQLLSKKNGVGDVHPSEPLSLQRIFTSDHGWVASLSGERVRTVIVTGDIIPARSVNTSSVNRNDFIWAFRNIARLLASGDITFINLETPLLPDCRPTTEGMVFCGSSRHVEGLVFAGVDIASLANNHAGNYDAPGVRKTKEILESRGITVTGISGPVYKDIKGKRFAFLGYNDIGAPQDLVSWAENETIRREVRTAKEQADIVLVMFHWGVEYVRQPSARQRELAHLAIDAGADLVLGNHPHWIQPLEIYRGKFIIYAHGNTIFDQMWSEDTKYGVIGKYVFYDSNLVDVEYFPTYIKDYGQPTLLVGEGKKRILDLMEEASAGL